MLVFITAENGRPYRLLLEIGIQSLLKQLTHPKIMFSDTKFSFTLLESSSNLVFRITSRLCWV